MQIYNLVDDLRPVILAAREFQDDRNYLSRFLPNVAVQSIRYRLGRRKRGDQTVPIRAFDAPAVPIKRPGIVDVQGDLPAITPIVNLTETDLNLEFMLAQQLAGQAVDYTPWVTAAAALAAATVDNTVELMRGQALTTGKVTLTAEDGDDHEVDFGVPSGNKITAATPWSADHTKVFGDLETAHERFRDSSGEAAGLMLTTNKVRRIMLGALQKAFPQQPVNDVSLNAYLSGQGLPGIVTYDRSLRLESGAKQRVYAEGHLAFLPGDGQVGRTEFGVTQEAVQQVQNRVLTAAEAPGLTVITLGQDNPVQRAVKGAAVALPVIQDNEDIVILSGLTT